MDCEGNINLVYEINHSYEDEEKLAPAEQIMTNKETKKITMHESWRWEEDEYKSCGTNFKLV
jgi:hypothetical protein